jgi:hypothetical protein
MMTAGEDVPKERSLSAASIASRSSRKKSSFSSAIAVLLSSSLYRNSHFRYMFSSVAHGTKKGNPDEGRKTHRALATA